MQKIQKIILSALLLLVTIPACITQPPALSDFDYTSASVLPYYTRWGWFGQKYVILSRERWGRDAGTYDDFGGKRDKGENHPLITAAREFWEEAILDGTINLNLAQTINYLDIASTSNTHYIIANTTQRKGHKNVTYITHFNKYKTQFINNFYKARRQTNRKESKEKDSIAIVKWNDLKQAIIHQKQSHIPVYINASVINPINDRSERKKVQLRPYLAIKLKNFFRDQPYVTGKNRKIRFYS